MALFKQLHEMTSEMGVWTVINYYLRKKLFDLLENRFKITAKNKYIRLRLKGFKYPIWSRYGTSDSRAFHQVFIRQEYSSLSDLKSPSLIIDCGTNVGYSAIYFLNKYPNAHLIAVEPDINNFKACERNLLPYSDRVSLVNSAIWSNQAGLVICRGQYRDGLEWSTQVRENQGDEKPDIYAIDISSLLEKSGFENIDILKIDVERAEIEIFSRNYENWLNKVKNIIIELHDEECEKIFFKALSMYKYDLSRDGDLTVCKNISFKS
ncbi:MAG: FkbM family methyltransferase [Komarekiella atlantica HA4396-MV6]|nr:FkbM family methyltransferase [Komarekiella atlantica HA4396-MV6]